MEEENAATRIRKVGNKVPIGIRSLQWIQKDRDRL